MPAGGDPGRFFLAAAPSMAIDGWRHPIQNPSARIMTSMMPDRPKGSFNVEQAGLVFLAETGSPN